MDKRIGILMCIVVALVAIGTVNASLVCYLPLDGDPNDHSGNNYPSGDGTEAGDAHYVQGVPGIKNGENLALDFDGDADYIQVMVAPVEGGGWEGVYTGLRPQVTIAMWIKMEALPVPNPDAVDLLASRVWAPSYCNFEFYNNEQLGMDTPFFIVQEGTPYDEYPRKQIDPNFADPNAWTHLCVTYDTINQEAYMYENGVPGDKFSITSGTLVNIGNYTLGGNAGGNYRYFDGKIDELYIFDQALTQEEVVNLMEGILPDDEVVHICGDAGYYLADINTDCFVNIDDFALMASQWLNCSDLSVEGCEEPPPVVIE